MENLPRLHLVTTLHLVQHWGLAGLLAGILILSAHWLMHDNGASHRAARVGGTLKLAEPGDDLEVEEVADLEIHVDETILGGLAKVDLFHKVCILVHSSITNHIHLLRRVQVDEGVDCSSQIILKQVATGLLNSGRGISVELVGGCGDGVLLALLSHLAGHRTNTWVHLLLEQREASADSVLVMVWNLPRCHGLTVVALEE